MISIEYKINGKKVSPQQMKGELEKAVLAAIADDVKQKVGRVRCKTHHQHARISVEGRSLDKLRLRVRGCCDDFVEEVQKQLS